MKLNSSFHLKNHYSQTAVPGSYNNRSSSIGSTTHHQGGKNQSKEYLRKSIGSTTNPFSFATVQPDSPKIVPSAYFYGNQGNYDRVNQTIDPHYSKEDFQSLPANKKHKATIVDEFERALSYNIMKTHKKIETVEKEFEVKIDIERQRYKEKENENKQKIKELVKRVESEKDKRLMDLTNQTELKKKNIELRKRMSELIYENNQLKDSTQGSSQQVQQLSKILEQQQNQIQGLQSQLVQTNQKMAKKIIKRETILEEQAESFKKEIRKLQRESSQLQQANKEMEFELYAFKKQGQESIREYTQYEDRIKQLLFDLEEQSKKHINDINGLHDYYRQFVSKSKDLEDRIGIYQSDYELATQSERAYRMECVRLRLQLEEYGKMLHAKDQIKGVCEKCMQSTIGKRQHQNQNVVNPQVQQQQAQKRVQQEEIRNQPESSNKKEDIPQNNQKDKSPQQKQQQQQQPAKAPKVRQTSQQEQQVLSNLVDNIQQNSALCNGNIRRTFSLQNLLFKGNKMISKNQMMDELAEYENLIRAMGALFYTSKRMSDIVPCVFQAWKEYAFEMKANKIINFISDSKKNQGESPVVKQNANGKNKVSDLDKQKQTIHYDNNQSEFDYEDNEDMQANDEEEFMRVQDSNRSYTILPVNNLQPTNQHENSQYEDGEDNVSFEEEEEDNQDQEEEGKRKEQQQWDFNEDDPEVQNAKLLEKYAQMSGAHMADQNEDEEDEENNEMIFMDENGQQIDSETAIMMMNRDDIIQGEDGQYYYRDQYEEEEEEAEEFKDIITADDYIDDNEEAAAQRLQINQQKQQLKDKILHQPSTSNEGSASKKDRRRDKLKLKYFEEVDEDGNLYLCENR